MAKIKLGDKAKDKISGYEGVVIGISEYLHGCRRIAIQPEALNKDGKPMEAQWFDEPQLQIVKPKKLKRGKKDTGGPMPSTPTRRSDAER